MKKKEKNRLYKYDNIKFLMIILVVVGHFINLFLDISDIYKSLFILIYSLHMPLFMFVSGQFHKNENITKKVVSYLLIYIVLKVTLATETRILSGNDVVFNLFSDSGLPWFMFVLAIFVGLSYILRNFDKRYILIIFILLSLFAGFDSNIGNELYLSRIIYFYPFYILGEMIPKEKMMSISTNKKIKVLSIIIVIIIVIISIAYLNYLYPLRSLVTGNNGYTSLPCYDKGLIYRGALYIFSLIFGFAIFVITPNKDIKYITKNGQLTLQIYFWHWIIGKIIFSTGIQYFFIQNAIGKFTWIFVGVLVSFICCLPIFKFPTQNIIDTYSEKKLKKNKS